MTPMIDPGNVESLGFRRLIRRFCPAVFAFLIQSALTRPGNADGFDTLGDYQKLKGQTILAAGNASKFFSPTLSEFDSLSFSKMQFYQIADACFGTNADFGFGDDISGKSVLLLVDGYKNISIAILEPYINEIKVSLKPVDLYDCSSITNDRVRGSNSQLENELRRLRQKLDKLTRALQPPQH